MDLLVWKPINLKPDADISIDNFSKDCKRQILAVYFLDFLRMLGSQVYD